MKSGISRLHTQTARSTPTAVAANTNWESAREREGFCLHLGEAEEAGHAQL